MPSSNNTYLRSIMLGFLNSLEYRLDFFLSIFGCFFPIVMQSFLWTVIFNHSAKNTVYGYTLPQLILYAIIAGILSKVVSVNIRSEICEDIKMGGLSKYLIMPLNYFFYRFTCHFGQKLMQTLVFLVVLFATMSVYQIHYRVGISALRVLEFVIAMFLAIILNYLIYYIICMAAFWITEASSLSYILSIVFNIVGGSVFPLDIFGKNLNMIFKLLPFQYTIYYPTTIINGASKLNDFGLNTGIMLLWIIGLYAVNDLLWKIGIKKYTAAGG